MSIQTTPEVKKTLTVVDRSAKSLLAASDAVQKAITDLTSITGIAVGLSQEIEFKQSELNALSDQYVAKEREEAADLRLRVKENEEKVLAELLKSRGVVAIPPAQIKDLENMLAQSQASNEIAIATAVKEAESRVAASFNARLAAANSDHKVETATLQATNGSLSERNVFLTAQITQLQAEIQKERDARVQIAQAEANKQGVVVNAGK